MDEKIIAHNQEKRYHRALQIAARINTISPNGIEHQYYIRSLNGRGRYLAATSQAFPDLGVCDCRDFQDFAQHNGFQCKHIQAVEIYEKARAHVRQQAQKHGITVCRVRDLAFATIEYGQLSEVNTLRVKVVIAAATILEEEDARETRRQSYAAWSPTCHKKSGKVDHCDDCLYVHLCANAERPRGM